MQKERFWKTIRIACTALLLGVGILLGDPLQTRAAEPSQALRRVDINPATDQTDGIYYDEETKEFVVWSYAMKRTSTITYGTIGLTISECADNEPMLRNGAASDYIQTIIFMNGAGIEDNDVVLNNNIIYVETFYRMSAETLVAMIRDHGNDAWADRVEECFLNGGQNTWVKLDPIMTTYVNDIPEGSIWRDGTLAGGKVYYNRPADNNAMITQLERVYGWRDPSKIRGKFNHYISRDGSIESKPDEVVVPNAKTMYETMNYSDIYDISVAIPSGEAVTNKSAASCFTGNDLPVKTAQRNKGYSVTFDCTMTYEAKEFVPGTENEGTTKTTPTEEDHWEGEGELKYYVTYDKEYDPVTKEWTVTEHIPDHFVKVTKQEHDSFTLSGINALVSYQYISAYPQIYELEKMDVYNGHFPDTEITDAYNNRLIRYTKDNAIFPEVTADFHIYSNQALATGTQYARLQQHMMNNPSAWDYTPREEGYHYQFYPNTSETVSISFTGKMAGDWSNFPIQFDRLCKE